MEQNKHKLVIDGNAFYELDLECLKQKKEKRGEAVNKKNRQQQRQRK